MNARRLTPVSRRQRRTAGSVALALVTLVPVAAGCSFDPDASAEAPATTAAGDTTLSVSPLPGTDSATTAAPPTAAPAATDASTTEAPSTTTTTLPPAPTTTLAPNVELVQAWVQPLEAVGQRGGEATRQIQWRLLELGFWNAGPDGEYGHTTKQAVMAFQKYIGLPATGSVDATTAAFLTNMTERARGTADAGTLVEVDKTRQLLFVVQNGKTVWTVNTSTGDGLPYEEEDQNTPGEIQKGVSITPSGLWKVNRERPEGWWEGDLGKIYRPKYFRGGVAVHGSSSIPNYPASHGCVRVSVPFMDFVWDQGLMPMGTTVWVHGG
jgi:peptidoglycan hydrolase-like protein with peptidoglycan-binding domain